VRKQLAFSVRSIVADVGSGTGILTELLLENGNTVFGIEPNEDMRRVAELRLSHYPAFRSVNGTAESTGLPGNSVDFITAAQSFHWFQPAEARREFRRILRIKGWVVLIWNTRKTTTPFLQEYEELVNWIAGETKNRVKHEDLADAEIAEFLGTYDSVKLQSSQRLNLEGLMGRVVSASYSPLPGEPLQPELARRVTELFDRHERNGTVEFEYWTEVYSGQLCRSRY
jgi:SAM-dependent methyltransferase